MNNSLKIRKKSPAKKWLLIAVAVGFVAAGAGGYYFYRSSQNTHEFNNPTTDNTVADKGQPLIDAKPSGEDKVITPTVQEGSGEDRPEKPLITRATQTANGSVRISATLANASDGTCGLQLKKDGAPTVERSVRIIVGPFYYTCDGFLIPRADIPQGGSWSATIIHNLNGGSVSSDAVSINVE